MKLLSVLLVVVFVIQSLYAESNDEEETIVSEYRKSFMLSESSWIFPEREAFNYREHLVDLTRMFPGFDYNNELTDDGADFLEQSGGFAFWLYNWLSIMQ